MIGPVLSPERASVLKISDRSIFSGKLPSKALIAKLSCAIFALSKIWSTKVFLSLVFYSFVFFLKFAHPKT